MITPTTGMVYRFNFKPDYTYHDGVYKLVQLMTYDEYLQGGGVLTTDFFIPAGKAEEDIAPYMPDIRYGKMMKLISPDPLASKSVKMAPLAMLDSVPDYTVSEYKNIGIISHIGVVKDATALTYVQDNLVAQVQAALGITIDPKFVATGSQWLTDEEYQEELAKRDSTIMKTVNYFSENTKLVERISQLQTLLTEYEALIIHQDEQIKLLKG